MKKIILMLAAVLLTVQAFATDLDYLRNNYGKAVQDNKLCQELINSLSKRTESHVHLGYLGAFQTIWANHTSNPLSKLKTFNKGKKNIEQAIKADPDNVELRFIRLSVQKNVPSFLGYKSNIKEDQMHLEKHKSIVVSASLKDLIKEILEQ